MALTMYDIARLKDTNFEKGIVEMFIRESDLLKVFPFENIDTMSIQTRRMASLPPTQWRERGQRFFDGGQVGFETVVDSLFNTGAEINIDDADMKDKGPFIVNPLKFNTEAKVKAIVYDFHDKVINGDHAVDPNSFEGLKVRIGGLASTQSLYTASLLDVRPSTITVSNAYTWLERIDEAKYACDGHTADICLTDGDFIRALKHALRVIGQYVNAPGTPPANLNERESSNFVAPTAGRAFVWDEVRYIDMGVKADQTTHIVATETIGSACRPAYFVKLGDAYLNAIQYAPLDVKPPFMLDDGVTFRSIISWYVGLRHVHNRFAVKMSGSQVA